MLFDYYVKLGLKSFNKNRTLTALMVLSIAVGVAASVTAYGVFQAMSADPIPSKSSVLYVPQLDVWGGSATEPVVSSLSYNDAIALLKDHRANMQTAVSQITSAIVPGGIAQPFNVNGYAVSNEFFRMLEISFLYGSGWSAAEDEQYAKLVVISSRLNRRLFHGENSVGKNLSIEGGDYRIVGVLGDWSPQLKFYDVAGSGGFATFNDDIYVPITTAMDKGISNTGNMSCRNKPLNDGRDCVWISYMAQIDNARDAQSYLTYLNAYVSKIVETSGNAGRNKTRLYSLRSWMQSLHVVPPDAKISLIAALSLLLVCIVNTAGLLLAKFISKSGEVGLRRALGATKAETYYQLMLEATMVGLAGGVGGVVILGLAVYGMHHLLPARFAGLSFVNVPLLAFAVLLSLMSALAAAIYPASRAAGVQPAWWIKAGG